MDLNRIVLPVLDVDHVAAFHGTALGLPVEIAAGKATVVVGRSRLELHASEETTGCHHLAMTIPTGSFGAARSWLEARARLLSRAEQDEFEGPATWNSRSLYFDGPEGAVLELIERRDLPPGRSSTFSTTDLVCVSEVGIAVPDVEQAVAQLTSGAGVETYGDPAGPEFAAVGDVHGLLILVRAGRAWLPTSDRLARPCATTVETVGARPGTYGLAGGSTVHVHGPGAEPGRQPPLPAAR